MKVGFNARTRRLDNCRWSRETERVVNQLSNSVSPYLLQHADNPVDWWEWGPEAFAEARRRDVPIFLSVGYSACHWCHVMAHESFESDEIAALMNERFVNIKVDREERPDVDAVYMDATTALTGRGGWPMSVFLGHDAKPFYAGTYFPPEPRHGMPSFPQVLTAISDTWRERRDEIDEASTRITEALNRQASRFGGGQTVPTPTELSATVALLTEQYDPRSGGFGSAPKFPPSMVIDFLLRHHSRTGDELSIRMVEKTCTAMARGGIFDQLAGGFARYSVDADWVVPHFEKMLYDNALLLRAYTRWWRVSRSSLAERVVRQTVDFLLTELRTAEGGFAAALDADSEGEEGLFYVWTPTELVDVLGSEDGAWVADLCDVTVEGTFEKGASTLQLQHEPEDDERWQRCRAALLDARATRVRPARDDKIVAAWNGMTIAALVEAGTAFDEPDWIAAAVVAGDLLIGVHLGGSGDRGRLVRTSRDGKAGAADGVLEDYACVADALIRLCMVTGRQHWLVLAGGLLEVIDRHFGDGEGGFFDTPDDGEQLILRPHDPADGATPAGWMTAAQAFLDYSALTGSSRHREIAEGALVAVSSVARVAPRAAGAGLAAVEALQDGPREVAIIGDLQDQRTQSLLLEVATSAALSTVWAFGDPQTDISAHGVAESSDDIAQQIPLLAGRVLVSDQPAAYVCRQFVCQRPVTDPVELRSLLSAGAVT